MYPSRFNIIIPDYPEPKKYLCFNTLTQSMVVLDKDIVEILKRKKIPSDKIRIINNLCKLGILAEDHVDEERVLKYLFDRIKYDNSIFHITVLTTYDCNFSCIYCVEEGVKGPTYMSSKTSTRVVDWIKDKAKERGPKTINITFYGGEPLLHVSPIEFISRGIKKWTEENGIGFSFGIITNGSLLRPKLIERLIPLGLKGAKITIDGIREVHDKRRPFKGGKGSFDIIIKNVIEAVDRIAIHLGGNVDEESIHKIPLFLDYLEEIGLKEKLAEVDFKPIMGQIGTARGACYTTSLSDSNIFIELFNIKKELIKRGFKTRRGFGIEFCKMVNNELDVSIDPIGNIYKCPAMVGRDETLVGNIYEEEFDYRFIEMMTEDVWKKCIHCPYVPLCGGGCRYAAYLKTGDFYGIACEKRYFETILPEIIKLEYKYQCAV